MASKPSHPRLADHNARVLRLARDYDKKYRPVLIPVAKHMNLETGDSFPRIQRIMRESARYTGNRKPLSRASVFRLLAEMADAGAIKTEARFGPTGRQRSSYRYLDLHVAVRFGQPVEHLWDAPMPEDETPGKTPGETPDETPITLSISLKNSPSNSGHPRESLASPGGEREKEKTTSGTGSGMCNTYIIWEVMEGRNRSARDAAKGSPLLKAARRQPARGRARDRAITMPAEKVTEWAVFRQDRPPKFDPPKHARTVTLSPAEATFMWNYFGKKNRAGHASFLRSSKTARASLMARYDSSSARAERAASEAYKAQAQAKVDAQCAAERAERAPLVARYAELTGQAAEDIEKRVKGMGGRASIAYLESRFARKEGK